MALLLDAGGLIGCRGRWRSSARTTLACFGSRSVELDMQAVNARDLVHPHALREPAGIALPTAGRRPPVAARRARAAGAGTEAERPPVDAIAVAISSWMISSPGASD